MDRRFSRDVVVPSLQPDWTVAKRSASPIDVDSRSPKRPPAPRTSNSSGQETSSLGAPQRRAYARKRPTHGRDRSVFNFAYAENNVPFPGDWTELGSHHQHQHYQASPAAYTGGHVGIPNGPPVTFALGPGALGSSTPPPFPTSYVTNSSLSYASDTAPVPLGPVSNADAGADHSPSFSPSSSFPGLRNTDAGLSHLTPTMLFTAPDFETKSPVESHGPGRQHALAYHGPDVHIQDSALHVFGWPQTVASTLGSHNTSADVPLPSSGYIFAPTQPGPHDYRYHTWGTSPLQSFDHHLPPPYRNPYPVTNLQVDPPSALDPQTAIYTAYPYPSTTMYVPDNMFYNTEQQVSQDDRLHEHYVQVVHPGHNQHAGPEDLAGLADMTETVVAHEESPNGPAHGTVADIIRQHLPRSFSPGTQSLPLSRLRHVLQNSLSSEATRLGAHDGYLPDDSEGGSESDVSGRADSESARNQPERKKRGPFDRDKREKVNKTRKRGACLVCKMQRNECTPNKEFPDDPDAPCMRCLRVSISRSKKVVYRVPCMRSTISQLVLHRPGGLGLTRRWEGAKAKDVGDWADDTIRTIHMFQGLSLRENPMIVKVRKFMPKEGDVLCKGSVHLEPYCLADVEQTAKYFDDYLKTNAVHACTNSCIGRLDICRSTGLEQAVKGSHYLVRDTYAMAVHHATRSLPAAIAMASGPTKDSLEHEQRFLLHVIKFIYAIKHMSGSVEIIGEDKLNMESATNPSRPVWLPRMIVAQWDGIQNERILKNLTKNVLSRLDKYLTKKDHRVWFTIYLVVFLFLHEVSVASKDRLRWAQENASLCSWSPKTRYGSGKLGRFVEHLQASTNTLLAHWEYYKAGVDLQSFDWDARHDLKQLNSLTSPQADFVRKSVAIMQKEEHSIPKKPEDGCWEHELYFISHMFRRHEKAIETFNYVEP